MPARALLNPLDLRRARPGFDPTKKLPSSKQPDASRPFKMRDGNGLWLEVRPSGKKVWRYRYRIGADEQTYTIGDAGEGVGQIGLAEARAERDRARELVRKGIHPKAVREADRAHNIAEGENTFKAVALDWLADNAPHWTEHYTAKARRMLEACAYRAIGDKPIRSVTPADVLEIVKSKKARATQALLLQQRIGSIFRYAIRNLRAETDPTYSIRGAIKRPPVRHHQPLALSEIPAFRGALRATTGNRQARIAVELLLLTFVRPGELRAAAWSELDLDGAMWVIPAERMKMRETHYVPLSSQVVALLRELHKLTGKREHLFPSVSNPRKCMDHSTLWRAVERVGYGDRFSPHGFRATASTALNGMQFRPDVIERQLAHTERNQSRASYNQQAYMEERRTMMQTWADMIDAKAAESANSKVIPIRATEAA
jgi:integrase